MGQQHGGGWLELLAQEDAAQKNALDEQRKQTIELYVKSREWARQAQEAQRKQEHDDFQQNLEAQRERRLMQDSAETRRRSDRDYAAQYVQREREMIYKNIEIMKGLNQAYWAAVKAEGKSSVDARMQQAQAVNAATIQAIQLYQGNLKNQQVQDGSDGLLNAEHGFYTTSLWKSIQTQLKNDPVLIQQVKNNLVNYAKLPAEAREAELANYVHDLQLSKASNALTSGAQSFEETQAKLEKQTHYLLQQLPAMPPPEGYGQPAGVPQDGGVPGQPAPTPRVKIPRGAFGGAMTVTDENGKKRTYMVPSADADDTVHEAADMYNASPKAQEGNEYDEWFGAKQAFNDFLNSPYEDSLPKTPKEAEPPALPRPRGLHPAPEPRPVPGPF